MNLIAPKKKSKAYYKGWKARLAGEKRSSNPYGSYNGPVNHYYGIWMHLKIDNMDKRGAWEKYYAAHCASKDWDKGSLAAGRALGRIRKAERVSEETKRLNKEHDWLSELGEEFAA